MASARPSTAGSTEALRLAVISHKGGVGKTTVAVNLSGALAEAGHRVTLVDCDPQAAASAALRCELVGGQPGLYEALMGKAALEKAMVPVTGSPGLSVVPSSIDLAGADVELPRRSGWQTTLRGLVAPVPGTVVLDTAPALGVLPYIALVAATAVIIVCPWNTWRSARSRR